MRSESFHFEIKGEDVEPGSVPLRDLLDLLRYLNATLVETARSQGLSEDEIDFSLTELKKGNSSDHNITASPRAIKSVDFLTRRLANRNTFGDLPQGVQKNVREMWRWAHDFGADGLAFTPNGSRITPAVIDVADGIPGERITYSGKTTLYGECISSGGAKQRSAKVRFPDGKIRAVRLKNLDLAKELGHRLYQRVGLIGRATWDAETKKIVVFQADRLSPYRDRDPGAAKPRTISEAFEELARASGGRWENVDPDEFVQEQRRD
ncbi:MAG: hypothetical protein M3552_16800 [Planctomycetota bacterium]|nr:hypothetical protein [Planctomycetota bacterium]